MFGGSKWKLWIEFDSSCPGGVVVKSQAQPEGG